VRQTPTAEHRRLSAAAAGTADWRRWGTYVSDRAWGTVREDYSDDGSAWEYLPHDHARSRAYRWNEDGLAGFSDRDQYLCLGPALWNERDAILKERLFGLSNAEGNHGEDVKEYYFYLDNTPTHAYARMLYKYPQVAFPYADLVDENARRGADAPEYELFDAIGAALRDNRYFDVSVEYAKAHTDDILCRIQIVNRAAAPAPMHVVPLLWYRNTWSSGGCSRRGWCRRPAACGCSRWRRASVSAPCSLVCSTSRSFFPTTASDRCRAPTSPIRTASTRPAKNTWFATCPANRTTGCSAATPTGEDRSGFR